MSFPKKVHIVEVGPRDGLQNERKILTTRQRIELIINLADAGLKEIEVGSFVSPKRLPQMSNTTEVFAGLSLNEGLSYPVLVPNTEGMQQAIDAGVKNIAIFAAASETFSHKNINCGIDESIQRYQEVMKLAKSNDIAVRGYVSCISGCPYEGQISPQAVVNVTKQLLELGCYQISLGDTIGTGTPLKTRAMLKLLGNEIGLNKIAVHFHDTYGQAIANIYVALEMGITTIDSAVAGLGGCPYAKGASGNVATEDLVYMLNEMNIKTGVDLNKLVKAGRAICKQLESPVRSKVNLAWNLQAS